MSELEAIENILANKKLDSLSAKTAYECMVELCQQCGMKKQFAKLGSMFENLTDGVLVFDLDYNLADSNKLGTHINKQFKIFNYKGNNYKLSELPLLKEVAETKKNTSGLTEVSSQNQYRQKHIFSIGCSPIFSETNVLVGICLIMTDMTEMQKQAKQMEDIVSALTHDLKTPLIAAETNIKHFLDGRFGELTTEQEQILLLLSQSNADALRLVKNLLNVFKHETKSYKLLLEPVDIEKLFTDVYNSVKPLLDEKCICLKSYNGNFLFICDPFEIERVIINLLINAIAFTPPKGEIELKAIKNEDGNVIISIEDNGTGISGEVLPELFERFWQSKKRSVNANSTGLGLYLSRQIVEAHGGKIWATSELGKGTKVNFEIPLIA